jgi:CheY-like chemotaxis protein
MKTVLVVDDDASLRQLYKEELESEGYRVVLASDGLQALDVVAGEPPDVVVMDIRMPAMDGLEAMTRLLRERGNIPVILHTAYGCYQDNFLAWAADGYLLKSSDLAPLKDRLREILNP